MTPTTMLRTGAVLAALAVAAGAFGAHGLEDLLAERGTTATFETAVRYQMWHALALLLCAALHHTGLRCTNAAWCFVTGTVIFSGTLYGIALTGPRWLGAITPIGGVLMLAGWVALALARYSAQVRNPENTSRRSGV